MSSVQHSSGSVVDVRSIVPRERHPLIFNTFHELEPGQDFILVNDHDPKPLYYHFKAEYDDTFDVGLSRSGPRCLARPHQPHRLSRVVRSARQRHPKNGVGSA